MAERKKQVKTRRREKKNIPAGHAHIQASFKNGVLEMRLPKSEKAKPKQIPITQEEEASGNGRRRAAAGAESPR